MSIFVLESPGGVEEFARAYAHYVGASTMRTLCDELRDLLKDGVMLMADRIYFVDTAIPADKKKKGKNKTHVVFDGGRVFRVRRLTELEDAGEILIDALFPELYDEILELLRRGAKAYLLKDATKLKRLRVENKMRKSDENDVITAQCMIATAAR